MVALADVLVPPNEEGTRATVLKWCKRVGESVEKDEPLVELETDKVTVEIPSPASGTLIEILKQVDAEVIPDEVIARLSLGGAVSAPRGGAWPAGAESAAGVESRVGGEGGAGAEAGYGEAGDGAEAGASAAFQAPRAAAAAGAAAVKPLSPSVRRLLKEHSIAAADIGGTGRDGRITAQDVIRHAANAVNGANTLTRANATGAPDAPDPIQPGYTRVDVPAGDPGRTRMDGLATVMEQIRPAVPVLRLVTGSSVAETSMSGARAGRGVVELELPNVPTVSREHARFTFADGRWWVTNQGMNGISVNGAPVSGKHPLSGGDSIRWGSSPDALLSRVEIG